MTDNETLKDASHLPGYNNNFRVVTAGGLKSIEKSLEDAKSIEEVKDVLMNIETLQVTSDHLDLVADLGMEWGANQMGSSITEPELENYALRKLRQLYYEVIKFDLVNGTQTSGFIPETLYRALAEKEPEYFAGTKNVEHGVRHRASLTSVVKSAFDIVSNILEENNIKISDTSLYDWGCGTGKPALIARQSYKFKNVVGIDYFMPLIEIGKVNRQTMGYAEAENKIAFVFKDAAEFDEFQSPIACYAYNPFDKEVMAKVVQNLEKTDQPVVFAYNKPLHGECFDPQNGWTKETEIHSEDNDSRLTVFSRNLHLNAA